ncbi:RNA polymerase sigma factor [Aequorivita sp. H23M31]|uniref:RNA polymerase sigma factor n=1 Tax=Aequorivita ciconiae TaxID=2494375 RepID=A0A410FZX7_9FLAO|nr:RNA polymerase sigma factor [Aequorivita sp. H23M31]QAA80582.1 RNA polymerase sigma factor [Aequorivita sp. H23M31]
MIPTNLNIDDLLILCKKDNRLAQAEIYDRYQRAMFNVSVRIVKDPDEAEDVMQESFITAFDKLESFKGEAPFGAWLKRIVINKSLNHLKKSEKYAMLSEKNLRNLADESYELDEEDYSKIKAAKVMESLAKLHTSYNRILTLHLIEGYDYEELCEILNISYTNCRTLISRAKDSLRKQLTL